MIRQLKVDGRKGVALLISVFVILAITAVAVLAIRGLGTEEKASYNLRLNRQAFQASHQAAAIVLDEMSRNAILIVAASKTEGLTAGLEYLENKDITEETIGEAWSARQAFLHHTYEPEFFTPMTGLGTTAPTAGDVTRLRGDLSRRVAQSAALGSLDMTQFEVDGFSEGLEFCSYFLQIDTAATIGLPPVNQGGFYYANDLERISATKRDMAKIQIEPIQCD